VSETPLRAPLLAWYRRNRRPLPWRATRDPYAIWVSEIMLQQTRVETVLRYYPRFLERFPTLAALARAPESAVLARWSGLGYYSRARSLREAARAVVARHGDELPSDVAALRALPGIGRYTAGAIASIAFGKRTAAVDGNVARVLSRLFRIDGAPSSGEFRRRIWELAEALLPKRSAGDWNQALMELGATICTPREPRCDRCPVADACAALASGETASYPEPARRPVIRNVRRACVVLEHGDRVLLARQDEGRFLRGLWRFPGVALPPGASAAPAVRRLLERLGIEKPRIRADGRIRHAIMDQRIETLVFRASSRNGRGAAPPGARWFRWRELAKLPLSTVELRLISE